MAKKRVGKLTTKNYGDLLMVEYIDGTPHNVVTSEGGYDFNESKRWGLLFHNHGGGGCYLHPFVDAGPDKPPVADVWIADDEEVTDGSLEEKVLSPRDILAMGYRIVPAPLGDPFEDARDCEGHIEYCDICEDYMPDDDECLCEHLFWVDGSGIEGPGYCEDFRGREVAAWQDYALPVIELACRAGAARRWRAALQRGRLEWSYGFLASIYVQEVVDARDAMEEDRRGVVRAQRAWGWFKALDEKTVDANRLTLEWLDLVIACQDERRASGAKAYALRSRWGTTEKDRYSWADALAAAKERRAKGERVRIVYVRPRAAKAAACRSRA